MKVPGPFPGPGSILDQDHNLLPVPGPGPGPGLGPGPGPGSGVVQRESPQIDLVKTVEIQMVPTKQSETQKLQSGDCGKCMSLSKATCNVFNQDVWATEATRHT